jgi:endonuclease/exonuclease/phosphatase family metal-dependent hydrolase
MVHSRFVCAVSAAHLAVLLLPLAGCLDPSGPTLRVVSWNVHACQAGVDNIAAELHKLNPDIVCLQEVESGLLDSPDIHEAERIARALNMRHVCSPAPTKGTKEEQLAIFARGELEDVELLENGTGRRYGISAEVELADDTDIRIVCVHLTSNATSDIGRFLVTGMRRFREVSDLTRRLDRWDENIILAGDFNSTPVMLEHTAIDCRMEWVGTFQPTFPSDKPVLQLDHLFLKGSLKSGRIFAEPTRASDHWLLVADIHLPGSLLLGGRSGASLFEPPEADDDDADEPDDD